MTVEADLLAAITRAPGDDKLRLVYADALMERGDPRGEFVQLELQHRASGLRLAELRKQLEPEWVEQVRRPNNDRRQFPTRDLLATLTDLRVTDHYAGPREGDAAQLRRFRLMQFDRELAHRPKGLVFPQLDRLHAEASARLETWLPHELARAVLHADWVPPGSRLAGRSTLEVIWLQGSDDPYLQLESLIRQVEWAEVAVFEPAPE